MKTYEIIEKIRNNINEALEEAYQRGKQDGFESNTAYRHGYYDGQRDAYKEREATEKHWGKNCNNCKFNNDGKCYFVGFCGIDRRYWELKENSL